MLLRLVLATATLMLPTLAIAAPAYVGKWSCEVAVMTITAKTYDAGSGVSRIAKVERSQNDYRIDLTDGYAFSLFNVTKKTMTWHSLASGDTFDCRRLK